ncbi:MAG: hypothetical protein ACQETM_11210 [Bacteroidota bacterium]
MCKYGDVEGLDIVETDALEVFDLVPFDFDFADHFLHHQAPNDLNKLFVELKSLPGASVLFNDLRHFWLTCIAYYIFQSVHFFDKFCWL